MPVPSTITDLSDSAASNFPQDSDSTGSTVASLPRNLSAIIKKQFVRGSDVAVVSSGSVTLNAEYSYFVVTGSGYNITGFSNAYNGRKVTLKFSGALTLVNSASLVLPSGANVTTAAGDVFEFVNESTGVWRCIQSTGNGLAGTTPAQFDNTTKLATTAFVQRALGNYRAYTSPNAALTLTADNAGHFFNCTGTSYTITLPPNSALTPGAAFTFINNCSGDLTIALDAADATGLVINGSGGLSSFVIPQGHSAIFVSLVGTRWDGIYIPGTGSPDFTGTPTAPTAAQFDNNTSIATTAFVQRALGNAAGQVNVTTTSTLSASNVGKRVNLNSAGITVTLPALSSVPVGSVYWVCASLAATIAKQAGDTLQAGTTSLTTFAMAAGEFAIFIAGSSAWNIEGGDVVLKYSPRYAASLAANGYQKLPSGLIIQWGNQTVTNVQTSYSYPLAFPTASLKVILTDGDAVAAGVTFGANAVSATQFSAISSGASILASYIAIGY